MFVHRRDVQIQWGDCDPANIVYYPRYFAIFDDSTSIMFEAAGFSKQDIIRKYGLVGIPMVDTRAKFYIASTHGDWIMIESRVESFKRSSFEVTHKVFKGEALAIGMPTRPYFLMMSCLEKPAASNMIEVESSNIAK